MLGNSLANCSGGRRLQLVCHDIWPFYNLNLSASYETTYADFENSIDTIKFGSNVPYIPNLIHGRIDASY
jgi:hypothetical protein